MPSLILSSLWRMSAPRSSSDALRAGGHFRRRGAGGGGRQRGCEGPSGSAGEHAWVAWDEGCEFICQMCVCVCAEGPHLIEWVLRWKAGACLPEAVGGPVEDVSSLHPGECHSLDGEGIVRRFGFGSANRLSKQGREDE
jgi:hypothetical protein